MEDHLVTNIMIEEKYQQLEHREHIYKLPDTYIGSIESTTQECFVLNETCTAMEKRTLEIVPGFFKIFDEILVNAIDHRQRDSTVRNIKVQFEMGLSEIMVQNDGGGIDVCIHKDTQVYVPEMLFGHLLTSSNYRENEKRTTGGKNGYGATLTSIFSKYFVVETVDATRQLKYVQKFSDNNQNIGPPKITKCSSKPYTKITFFPDYAKFGLSNGFTADLYALFVKRVYDVTAVTPSDLSVTLNGTKLKIKSMERYIELFSGDYKIFFCEFPRWKIGLVLSRNREFHQTSFVNGIWTMKGGRHVDYILGQIVDKTKAVLARLSRTKTRLFKPSQIKDHIWLFVDSVIENPSFASQTKEEMTTKISQFGSSVVLDELWIEKWMKNVQPDGDSFVERMVEMSQLDAHRSLKKTDGAKKSILRGIPKLEDALHAGTRHSLSCTLILTEGDSAKASILSGLSVLGPSAREIYGVFPLRGKFINVRDVQFDKVSANEEVKNLKMILGLQQGKVYTPENLKELRYGSIALATDADCDGSHIRGLILNFLHFYWPSLLEMDGFVKSLITPIVKGWFRTEQRVFYTLKDYEHFRRAHMHEKWTFKYYKGLGTSTASEFKEYFRNLSAVTRVYQHDSAQDLIMAFSKNQATQRKEWLKVYNPDDTLEYHQGKKIFLSDFVHKDLKHFSNYDNIRSIPNVIDGLKPSQRKVLFGIFKKGRGEIKVAQLASFVSEQTHYHHGEVSLEQTIVSLAQDFVGKSNLPLLDPKGQFGTRLQGGSDHAQSRYIYTDLRAYTPFIFNDKDQALLLWNEEESRKIEPKWYLPILPLVLCMGAVGIGTGYSTFVPTFHPLEIIDALDARTRGDQNAFQKHWIPWYRGFKGTIKAVDGSLVKFITEGVYVIDSTNRHVHVSELPIGTWTHSYKEHLESLVTDGTIHQYIDRSTDEKVDIEIFLGKTDDILPYLKLQTKLSLSNMYLYKVNGELYKFESVSAILEYFYAYRLARYADRKEVLLARLQEEMDTVSEQVRFIRFVVEEPNRIFRRPRRECQEELTQAGFRAVDTLLSMSIFWWTDEKIKELLKAHEALRETFEQLQQCSPEALWRDDLHRLRKELVSFY